MLAIRPDTWFSSEDTRFIKPKDLPARSTAAFAWRFSSDNEPSRSEILDKCSTQRQGEWGADGTPEFDIFAGGELRSKFGDPPGWKTKEQGKITQIQGILGVAIHSAKYLQSIEFSD
jgi:hypothetical protein